MNLHIFGKHDDGTIAQLQGVADEGAVAVALMADGHHGYHMPIGGVAAYDNAISVTGVGSDIACGNCAIQLDHGPLPAASMRELGAEIFDKFQFGLKQGYKNPSYWAPDDHPLFEDARWDIIPAEYRDELRAKARRQLGTIGSGNHYIDTFAGSDGKMWIGCHFGSRGFGYTVAQNFMAISQGEPWGTRVNANDVGGALLDLSTQAGQDYFDLMLLAGEYAYAGRIWVVDTVARLMGSYDKILDRVHNNHNFAWKERVYLPDTDEVWKECIVVRKGATPAYPGQRGFVGGSMGDDAVILAGANTMTGDHWESPVDMVEAQQQQTNAMFSTVHGAGRTMSRTKARGKYNRKTGVQKSEGVVNYDEVMDWLRAQGVLVWGADLDESPL